MAKILIVDDSETLRIQLKETLEKEDYTVIEGIHGKDGLDKARENPDIKLIITDFNMPHMNGVDMVAKIKEIPELAKIPVFMLTTEATPELKTVAAGIADRSNSQKPLFSQKYKYCNYPDKYMDAEICI